MMQNQWEKTSAINGLEVLEFSLPIIFKILELSSRCLVNILEGMNFSK